MSLIWATRGLTWGFRFLRNGGRSDPLSAYEIAFAGLENEREVCRRFGTGVALRFEDPLARKDIAGRVIPHDFVVFAPLSDQIYSIGDGLRVVWPLVADEYSQKWQERNPT